MKRRDPKRKGLPVWRLESGGWHRGPWWWRGLMLIWLGSLLGCATRIPPAGGPPDTEPPVITALSPLPNAVRVVTPRIVLSFDERVDAQSVEQAIHLSPLQEIPPTFSWSGRELTIALGDSLLSDRTYVLTIGSGAKDQHAGNRLRSPFQLAFTTGDSIDTGTIAGFVQDEKPTEVSLFAWRIEGRRADTLSPTRVKPDYAVTASDNGRFSLDHLAPGRYRVFAIRDRQRNFLYDIEADDIGADVEGDIDVGTGRSHRDLRFTVAKEDTTAPALSSVAQSSSRSVDLRLTEEAGEPARLVDRIRLRDSASGLDYPIVDVVPVEQRRASYRLYVSRVLEAGVLLGEVDSLVDGNGQVGRFSFQLAIVPDVDTLAPRLLETVPATGATNVPRDSAFLVVFSRPLGSSISLTFTDSARQVLPVRIERPRPHLIRVLPDSLKAGMRYSLCIDLGTCRDSLSQRPAGDSLFCVRFTTEAPEQYGTLTGVARCDADSLHPILLTIQPYDGRTGGRRVTLSTRSHRPFVVPTLLPGQYRARGFVDRNGNGRLDSGVPVPYTPGERFFQAQDSIRIRAKWETRAGSILIP